MTVAIKMATNQPTTTPTMESMPGETTLANAARILLQRYIRETVLALLLLAILVTSHSNSELIVLPGTTICWLSPRAERKTNAHCGVQYAGEGGTPVNGIYRRSPIWPP